jgi:AcrR family transcriptional regulator
MSVKPRRASSASAGTEAVPPAKSKSRRREILEIAATIFAQKGFDATTIRDIADASGVWAGSLYHHFTSKEEIFLDVHQAGIEKIASSVVEALKGVEDPWDRLEALAIAHCEALLSSDELPVIVSPYFSNLLGVVRSQLVAQRDRYEKIVAPIIDDLDLPAHIDPIIFRLHFLGALNWVPTWYNPRRGYTPRQIALQLVATFRAEGALKDGRSGKRPRAAGKTKRATAANGR